MPSGAGRDRRNRTHPAFGMRTSAVLRFRRRTSPSLTATIRNPSSRPALRHIGLQCVPAKKFRMAWSWSRMACCWTITLPTASHRLSALASEREGLTFPGTTRQAGFLPGLNAGASSGDPGERRQRLGQRLERAGLGVVRQVQDDLVGTGVAVAGHCRQDSPEPAVLVGADVDGTGDLAHVPADRGAVPGEDLLQLEPVLRAGHDGVPLLGPAGHRAQGALLAAAADGDRRVGPLDRLRLASRVGERDVSPAERRDRLAQQADDGLDTLVEPVEPLTQRRQFDAVGVALHLVPPGAQADLQPSPGDDVHGRGHVRQHRRVPVDHAGYLGAQPDPPGGLGHRGQHRPGLEARAGHVAAQRVEMIPVPRRLEQRDLIRRDPYVAELLPRLMLGPGLYREAHGYVLSWPDLAPGQISRGQPSGRYRTELPVRRLRPSWPGWRQRLQLGFHSGLWRDPGSGRRPAPPGSILM